MLKVNAILAISFLALLILYPVFMQVYLYRQRNNLTNKSFMRKWQAAYKGLNEKEYKFLLYPLFFFYRRILTPLCLIYFPKYFIVQQFTLIMLGVATVILIGLKRPFKTKSRNRIELLEEVNIIVISYHLFCFTEWLPDKKIQHTIGYSIITLIVGQVLIFVIIHAVMSIRSQIKACRNKFLIKKAAKGKLQSQAARIKTDSNRSTVRNAAKTLKKRRQKWKTEEEELDYSECFKEEDIGVASNKRVTTTNLQIIKEDE